MRVETAEKTARTLLSALPRRLLHVTSVARVASQVCSVLRVDPALLVSAAWLHDVGYSPDVSVTGFHPLDGARFLRAEGVDARVVNLVAHHSHALMEAQERGVEGELEDEFPRDESLPHVALCFCDMTTGPDGQRMTAPDRLAEIRERYGPDDLVTRFITRAEPSILASVDQVQRRLNARSAQSR